VNTLQNTKSATREPPRGFKAALSDSLLSWRGAFLFTFVFGFIVRVIPEILAFPFPLGFDSVYYAWRIESGVIWNQSQLMFSSWLLYTILIGVHYLTLADPFLLVKLSAAFLFGFNTCAVYYFATRALGWTVKKGLLAGVFFSLQAAAFVLSMDFYRNMLGLGILLFTLPLIKDGFRGLKQYLLFVLLSVLVVFSHEYASVILLTVFGVAFTRKMLKRVNVDVLKYSVAIVPALTLFLASFLFLVYPLPHEGVSNVIVVRELTGNYPGPLFFLTNYLAGSDAGFYPPAYLDLASQIIQLFMVLYVVVSPLVLAAFFRDKLLDSWTGLLLVGAFSAVVVPFVAFDYWYRWMLMMVYPFTFYAVHGVTKILDHSRGRLSVRGERWKRFSVVAVKAVLVLPFSASLIFLPFAVQNHGVPIGDADDAVVALHWVDAQMGEGSVLITHVAFSHWARLCVGEDHTLIYFRENIDEAINVASQHELSDVHFVWWNTPVDRYSVSPPSSFASSFNSGRISVFTNVQPGGE